MKHAAQWSVLFVLCVLGTPLKGKRNPKCNPQYATVTMHASPPPWWLPSPDGMRDHRARKADRPRSYGAMPWRSGRCHGSIQRNAASRAQRSMKPFDCSAAARSRFAGRSVCKS